VRLNKDRFIANLLEYSMGDLASSSESKRKDRSKSIIVRYSGVIEGDDGHARTVWEVPSQSSTGSYTVMISVEPKDKTLFSIAKSKWDMKKFINVIKTSDVKVHCTCPDFLYGGAKYNLGKYGKHGVSAIEISSGYEGEADVVTDAPDIRDPNRENVMCKHCIAVSSRFTANASKIMSQVRKYNPEDDIKEIEVKTSMNDAKSIQMVEVGKDDSNKITESLYNTEEVDDIEREVNFEREHTEEEIEDIERNWNPQELLGNNIDEEDEVDEMPSEDEYLIDEDEDNDDDEVKELDVDDLLDRPDDSYES